MEEARISALVEALLRERQLTADEADTRAGQCASAEYWTGLVPGASIGPVAPALDEHFLAPDALRAAGAQMHADGYCSVPPFLGPRTLAKVNDLIDAVVAAGWPPAFAWVFDDLWGAARAESVGRLLDVALGAGARQSPHLWIHIVPAVVGARGWEPHWDGDPERRSRTRLSVWIALTEARVDGGCIYVLPRSQTPDRFADDKIKTRTVSGVELMRLLGAVQALPAAPGAALAWNFDIMHWGGRCTRPGVARRALSLEWIADGETPTPGEEPLLPFGAALPPLPDRLEYVARALMIYGAHDPEASRFLPVAERLLNRPA